MIRDPKLIDISRIAELTKEVYGEFMTKHGMELNDANLLTTAEAFVKTKSCILCERGGKIVGIAAWHLSPHPGNYSLKIFQEVMWVMKSPEIMDASILLKALDRKAIELKADVVVMVNLSADNELRLRRIYEKLGYEYLESHYAKTIGG